MEPFERFDGTFGRIRSNLVGVVADFRGTVLELPLSKTKDCDEACLLDRLRYPAKKSEW